MVFIICSLYIFYLYAANRQCSAVARDRPQDMVLALPTTYKGLEYTSNSKKTGSEDGRNSPINDTPAPCTGGTHQCDELRHSTCTELSRYYLCLWGGDVMNIPLLASLTGSFARSYESRSNIARSVPEPACPAFKSSRADWKRTSMAMA